MNPTYLMDDPTFFAAAKVRAFKEARPLVTETLDAIANAADRTLAARAQGFDIGCYYDPEESPVDDYEAEVALLTAAIAADQIKRLLTLTQRFEFEAGEKARAAYDAQTRKAAQELDKAESNG